MDLYYISWQWIVENHDFQDLWDVKNDFLAQYKFRCSMPDFIKENAESKSEQEKIRVQQELAAQRQKARMIEEKETN